MCGDCWLGASLDLPSGLGCPHANLRRPDARRSDTVRSDGGSVRWSWRPAIQRAPSATRRIRAFTFPPGSSDRSGFRCLLLPLAPPSTGSVYPAPGVKIFGRRVAAARRMCRIYSIVGALALPGIFFHSASGQDGQFPDLTTIPTVPIADVSDDIKQIILTAVCHHPDTARDPECGDDSLRPLLVLADTVAIALPDYKSCNNRMDLSRIKYMEFIRGSPAVRMYGDRARVGVLRVYPKTSSSVRRAGTQFP